MKYQFGVRSTDLEQANVWAIAAGRFSSTAEESSDLGGKYFEYRGPAGEYGRLLSNCDTIDGSPILEDCRQWPVVLYVEANSADSNSVRGILNDPNRFVLVREG